MGAKRAPRPYGEILAEDYHAGLVLTGQPHLLVDVRTAVEYDTFRIEHAISIPLDALAERFQEIPPDQPVYVICASGAKSGDAAALLYGQGYRDVHNVLGGLMRWMMKDLPLVAGPRG
jgi:rhodanese-related sulfurtransferase